MTSEPSVPVQVPNLNEQQLASWPAEANRCAG